MLITTNSGRECGEEQFKCVANGLCIPKTRRCDDQFDCYDWSDEAECYGENIIIVKKYQSHSWNLLFPWTLPHQHHSWWGFLGHNNFIILDLFSVIESNETMHVKSVIWINTWLWVEAGGLTAANIRLVARRNHMLELEFAVVRPQPTATAKFTSLIWRASSH